MLSGPNRNLLAPDFRLVDWGEYLCCFFLFPVPPTDPSIVYDWFRVGVLDYDEETQQYLVQKTNRQDRIVDSSGNPVVNGGLRPDGRFN